MEKRSAEVTTEPGLDLPVDSVPLPSRGKIYGKSSFFYRQDSIEYKPMTPKQEDILFNLAYRKKGIAIEKMISSCLMETGIDINNLLIGDRDALMVAIRASGYGTSYEPSLECPLCDMQNDLQFDLSQIKINFLKIEPETPGENLFRFELPKSKHVVLFKFLTIEDRILIDKQVAGGLNGEHSSVTTFLLYSIVKINNVTDREKIYHLVMNMNAGDSNQLRKYINEHKPGLDMTIDFECDGCGHIDKVGIPTNHQFFSLNPEHREIVFLEPFFLLGYYFGMDFRTYYNMPVRYRRWLIERIDKEIRKAAEANKAGGSQIPSKGAHHNSPDIRAMAGKQRAQVPSRLRRFT